MGRRVSAPAYRHSTKLHALTADISSEAGTSQLRCVALLRPRVVRFSAAWGRAEIIRPALDDSTSWASCRHSAGVISRVTPSVPHLRPAFKIYSAGGPIQHLA